MYIKKGVSVVQCFLTISRLIDWCLTPTLAVFFQSRIVVMMYISIKSVYIYSSKFKVLPLHDRVILNKYSYIHLNLFILPVKGLYTILYVVVIRSFCRKE